MGWGGPFADAGARQYSTAGWLASLGPLFSPHYQVLTSYGRASGSVVVGGERTTFVDAPFYSEKNWGRAFPSRWWWIQCNSFTVHHGPSQVALTATGATRALLAGSRVARDEDVALVGLHLDGDFYPFPDVEWTVDVWGAWAVAATYEDLSVRIDAAATDGDAGCPVRVPTPDGMRPGATETYSGALTVEVTRGTERLLLASSDLACLEVGGDYGGEAWRAESAMTEPLKTIAFNLDLERAISTQLDNAQRRGWLDIPGL